MGSGSISLLDWYMGSDSIKERKSSLTAFAPADAPREGDVVNSRRQFLIQAPLGLLGAVAACGGAEQKDAAVKSSESPLPPGAPPTFGTAPGAGPAVSAATFIEAEKLAQVQMSGDQRDMAA